MALTELILPIILGIIIVYQGVMNYLQHKQVQTLIDKVMSRDYTQYTLGQSHMNQDKTEMEDTDEFNNELEEIL